MHRVFVDSNVLGSKTQYDWLFMLRDACSMFAIYASDDVLDEAHRVWRRKHPNVGGEMRRQREVLFRKNFDEVLDGWAGGEATSLLDADDAHVHNAAVSAGVDILLTNNVGDFGDASELPYDIYTPDEFFLLIESNNPQAVRSVTREQANYWSRRNDANPNAPRRTLAESLLKADCPGFAKAVAAHLHILGGAGGPQAERGVGREHNAAELVDTPGPH